MSHLRSQTIVHLNSYFRERNTIDDNSNTTDATFNFTQPIRAPYDSHQEHPICEISLISANIPFNWYNFATANKNILHIRVTDTNGDLVLTDTGQEFMEYKLLFRNSSINNIELILENLYGGILGEGIESYLIANYSGIGAPDIVVNIVGIAQAQTNSRVDKLSMRMTGSNYDITLVAPFGQISRDNPSKQFSPMGQLLGLTDDFFILNDFGTDQAFPSMYDLNPFAKRLFVTSQILTNHRAPWSGSNSTIIGVIQVDTNYKGSASYTTPEQIPTTVSLEELTFLHIQIRDETGDIIDLHGGEWSMSILFNFIPSEYQDDQRRERERKKPRQLTRSW